MNEIVIEHVPVTELPAAWQARLDAASVTRVTIRIEEEVELPASPVANNPLFGLWRDREDLGDVDSYMRMLRCPRYMPDDSPGEG